MHPLALIRGAVFFWLLLPALLANAAPAPHADATFTTTRWPKPPPRTYLVHGASVNAVQLKGALGTTATVTQKGAALEVKGCDVGKLSRILATGGNGSARVTLAGVTPVARGALTATQKADIERVIQAIVNYGYATNWGGPKISGGSAPPITKSLYPIPQCWKLVCPDCGPAPVGGKDCNDLKQRKDDLLADYNEKATRAALLQAVLQGFKDAAFWGGIGSLVKDIVTASVTLATAGGGTAAAVAAAELLGQMAYDGILSGMLEDVLGADSLGGLTEALVTARLASAEAARVQANAVYQAALAAWRDCMNQPGVAMTPAQVAQYRKDVAAYDACRRAVYLGESCSSVKATCP